MQKEYSTKLEQMQVHLNQCQSSGLRVSDYCKAHGVSKATYYYWHKKLNTSSCPSGFIELPSPNRNSFAEVVLPNGVHIYINQFVSPAYLKELACCI